MNQEIQNTNLDKNFTPFERIKRPDPDGKEFWSSRELAIILGYSDYRSFENVILKAKKACFNSGYEVKDHFVQLLEMIEIGKGGKRSVETILLSRYACYLIAQNADPAKEIVAQAQTYFAIQTRRQEIIDQDREDLLRLKLREEVKGHNKRLAGTAKEAGVVTPLDYAIFQNCGYMGLYGGLTMQNIHQKKKLKKSEHILDHMGSTELAANLFRATQAEDKIRREKITGKEKANLAHKAVGEKVRQTIYEIGGTMPENLPTVENIKKIKAQQKKELKKIKQEEKLEDK